LAEKVKKSRCIKNLPFRPNWNFEEWRP